MNYKQTCANCAYAEKEYFTKNIFRKYPPDEYSWTFYCTCTESEEFNWFAFDNQTCEYWDFGVPGQIMDEGN